MKNSFSVYAQVSEVGPRVLSVRFLPSLNIDPADSRLFSAAFVAHVLSADDRYSVYETYDGSFLLVACPEVPFVVRRDLVCHDKFSFTLDLVSGKATFDVNPVEERDVYATPSVITIGYRGSLDFVPNGLNDASEE